MKIRAVRADSGETYVLGELLPQLAGDKHPPLKIRLITLKLGTVVEGVFYEERGPDGKPRPGELRPVLEALVDDAGKPTGHGIRTTLQQDDPDLRTARIAIYALPDEGKEWYPREGSKLPDGRALRLFLPYPTRSGWVAMEGTYVEILDEANRAAAEEEEDDDEDDDPPDSQKKPIEGKK